MASYVHLVLTDDQRAFLREESVRTGLSMSELARRALDSTYTLQKRRTLFGAELRLGVWNRPDAAAAGRWNRVV